MTESLKQAQPSNQQNLLEVAELKLPVPSEPLHDVPLTLEEITKLSEQLLKNRNAQEKRYNEIPCTVPPFEL